jgi:hypothetical protein
MKNRLAFLKNLHIPFFTMCRIVIYLSLIDMAERIIGYTFYNKDVMVLISRYMRDK